MTKRLILTIATFATVVICSAQEKEKIKLELSGRVDAYAFTDTYKGIEAGGGIQYMMPARPNIKPLTHTDLNNEGSLRFGISSTRLGLGAGYKISPKFATNAFVEIDFMGAGGANPINIIRLRHAYMNLCWKSGSSLIIGQTSHLQSIDELAPPTVLFGGGYPFNALARPVQIRYAYSGVRGLNVAVAASMFSGSQGVMQSAAMLPDFSARVMVGDLSTAFFGVASGLKTLKPKIEGASQISNLYAWNASAFGLIKFGKRWTARAYVVGGTDMQSLGMSGAIAPIKATDQYLGSTTLSYWIDLDVNLGGGFCVGVFAGQQRNLGFEQKVETSTLSTSPDLLGLDSFYRIAPRVWYGIGKLQFGLEYLFTESHWSKRHDEYYRPLSMLPTATNHRVMLLARYNF